MLIPLIIRSIFVLAIVLLCLFKPNASRIFLGFFFLIMAIGVNGSFTFGNPQAYIDYASGALVPFYRDLALYVVKIYPTIFGVLLIAYEIAMGLLLIHKQRTVKIGLTDTMLFLIGITPLSILHIPWLELIIGEAYLLKKNFNTTFLEMVSAKFRSS